MMEEMYKWRRGHDKPHTGDLRRFGMANKGKNLTEEHKAKIVRTGQKTIHKTKKI